MAQNRKKKSKHKSLLNMLLLANHLPIYGKNPCVVHGIRLGKAMQHP